MAQYDVYPNPGMRSRGWVPYGVDVQSGLLSGLRTRLVMPLTRAAVDLPQPPRLLAPIFKVAGGRPALQPQTTAGLDAELRRGTIALLSVHAGAIRAALDAVISGL